MRLGSVCVGGGAGRRFGGDKLAARLGERTVLETSLDALRHALPDAPIVAVTPATRLTELTRRFSGISGLHVVGGGRRRRDSVRNGVEQLLACGCDVAIVHDAARPLVHPDDILRTVDGLAGSDGAILVARAADTVKRVTADGTVAETVPRETLRLALTPQVFRIAALVRAWDLVGPELDVSDEAVLLERAGMRVTIVEAAHPNPKITVPADLALARALLEARQGAAP